MEYKIKFTLPERYDAVSLARKLPNPVRPGSDWDIYTYTIEEDGFYFCDHLGNDEVAGLAFYRLVVEALHYGDSVEIVEL